MSTPKSLPACAKRHPGIASVIREQRVQCVKREPFVRPWCEVCADLIADQQAKRPRGKAARERRPSKKPYGLTPLSWAPPVFDSEATEESGAAPTDLGELSTVGAAEERAA